MYFTGVGDSMRYMLDHGMGFSRGSGGAAVGDKQYEELYRMVQNMSSEMSRRQQGITIMHSNGSRRAFSQIRAHSSWCHTSTRLRLCFHMQLL